MTFGELDAVTADLPPISAPPAAIAPPSRPEGRRRRRRGSYFSGSWRVPASPDRAQRDLMTRIAPLLHGAGYQLREQTPYRLLFVRTRRPVWTFALCVLVFPFGLLALLYTEEHHVAVDLQPTGRRHARVRRRRGAAGRPRRLPAAGGLEPSFLAVGLALLDLALELGHHVGVAQRRDVAELACPPRCRAAAAA